MQDTTPSLTTTSKQKRPFGKTAIFLLVAFAAGAVSTYLTIPPPPSLQGSIFQEVRANDTKNRFINPLLECTVGEELFGSSLLKLSKTHIEQLIENKKQQGIVSHVSVYYRDLNNGPWMGIEEKEPFFPASLLKVPIMMYYVRESERDLSLFQSVVTISAPEKEDNEQFYTPEKTVDYGVPYTVQELVERMIIYSDNRAVAVLTSMMPNNTLADMFSHLYVEPFTNPQDYQMNVKEYAGFFRVLFNASFLNNEHSEQALNLLTHTTFNKGLVAKLPTDVLVAHKFGEYWLEGSDERQLHDCGIVYEPNSPYMICIMTRGKNMDLMAETIAEISKLVYDQVHEVAKR